MKNKLNSFIGLTSVNEAEKLIRKERKEARNEFVEELVAYHLKYDKKQAKMESVFDFSQLKKINVNIWDDFHNDECVPEGEIQETYAYVEQSGIPDSVCHEVLSHIISHIKTNNLLPKDVKISLKFYDSTTKYPMLVGEHEYTLYKRWEIHFSGITHKYLDKLEDEIQSINSFCDVNLNIYSES